jgi:hypothetical protein
MDSHLLEGVSRRVTNDVLTVVVTGESLSYPRIQSDLTDSTQLNSRRTFGSCPPPATVASLSKLGLPLPPLLSMQGCNPFICFKSFRSHRCCSNTVCVCSFFFRQRQGCSWAGCLLRESIKHHEHFLVLLLGFK